MDLILSDFEDCGDNSEEDLNLGSKTAGGDFLRSSDQILYELKSLKGTGIGSMRTPFVPGPAKTSGIPNFQIPLRTETKKIRSRRKSENRRKIENSLRVAEAEIGESKLRSSSKSTKSNGHLLLEKRNHERDDLSHLQKEDEEDENEKKQNESSNHYHNHQQDLIREIAEDYKLENKDSLIQVTACLNAKRDEIMRLWQENLLSSNNHLLAELQTTNLLAISASNSLEKLKKTIMKLRKKPTLSAEDAQDLSEKREKVLEKLGIFESSNRRVLNMVKKDSRMSDDEEDEKKNEKEKKRKSVVDLKEKEKKEEVEEEEEEAEEESNDASEAENEKYNINKVEEIDHNKRKKIVGVEKSRNKINEPGPNSNLIGETKVKVNEKSKSKFKTDDKEKELIFVKKVKKKKKDKVKNKEVKPIPLKQTIVEDTLSELSYGIDYGDGDKVGPVENVENNSNSNQPTTTTTNESEDEEEDEKSTSVDLSRLTKLYGDKYTLFNHNTTAGSTLDEKNFQSFLEVTVNRESKIESSSQGKAEKDEDEQSLDETSADSEEKKEESEEDTVYGQLFQEKKTCFLIPPPDRSYLNLKKHSNPTTINSPNQNQPENFLNEEVNYYRQKVENVQDKLQNQEEKVENFAYELTLLKSNIRDKLDYLEPFPEFLFFTEKRLGDSVRQIQSEHEKVEKVESELKASKDALQSSELKRKETEMQLKQLKLTNESLRKELKEREMQMNLQMHQHCQFGGNSSGRGFAEYSSSNYTSPRITLEEKIRNLERDLREARRETKIITDAKENITIRMSKRTEDLIQNLDEARRRNRVLQAQIMFIRSSYNNLFPTNGPFNSPGKALNIQEMQNRKFSEK